MKSTILIVDDIEINRIILREILNDDYDILEAGGGKEAISIVCGTEGLPDVILLDIMMPDMDGYEVLAYLKNNDYTKDIPVLFITAADIDTNEPKALNSGAIDFIPKPFIHEVVKARVNIQVQLRNYQHNLEQMVEEKTAEINLMHQRILEALAAIVEYRSLESGQHIRRVKELARALVDVMLTKPEYREKLIESNPNDIIEACTLHDIGKVGVADSILLKPGRFTDEEFEIMKSHVIIGGDIVDSMFKDLNYGKTYLKHCKDIALYHHERWDGKGYMGKLAGEEIPISARILSIVDVYDAVSNKRCYKEAYSPQESMDIILEGRGTQFDPGIVDCFLEAAPKCEELVRELRD